MATSREAREDSIVNDLKTAHSDAQVAAYPDDPTSFDTKKEKVILVAYTGKNIDEDINSQGTYQHNRQNFTITHMFRNRRTHQGVLSALLTTENTLAGKQIDSQFMRLISENFVRYDPQLKRWVYNQTYQISEIYNNEA